MKVSVLVVALIAMAVAVAHPSTAVGLEKLRTRRVELPPVAAPAVSEAEVEAVEAEGEAAAESVMAELRSEADETTEDGANDDSAAVDAADAHSAAANADADAEDESEDETSASEAESSDERSAAGVPIHEHFRQFTTPMQLLPTEQASLAEVKAEAEAESGAESESESGASTGVGADGEGKGSNPTYILPVDPFNYFPFFNGFSNVNPFSQFYPPPPYLYPQYTNYMHRYASHGIGHAPAYPYAGAYGGYAGHHAFGHGAFPYNYPHPNPHMHYPFGAYKLDVSGPDVRTGENNPPPFPQFTELSSELITPEIIPKDSADEEDSSPFVVAELIEEAGDADEADGEEDLALLQEDSSDEADAEVEGEADAEVEGEADAEVEDEVMADQSDHFTSDVELVDEDGADADSEMAAAEIVDDAADEEDGAMTEVEEYH